MGELYSVATEQSPPMAPVAAFGGVLTVKQLLPVYRGVLASGPGSTLPDSRRFFPIPKDTLRGPAEMYEQFEEQFVGVQEKLDERMVLVGHSLGAMAAIMVGLRHPDKVGAVVCLAGVQDGVRDKTLSMWALERWLGSPAEARYLDHDSDFMQEQRRNIATHWPSSVQLHLISPTFDNLIPSPQGLGVELPEGQTAQRYIAAPRFPGLHGWLRHIEDMPTDVQLLNSRFLTEHNGLPLSGAVIRHIQDVRRVVAEDQPFATVQAHDHLFRQGHMGRQAEWQLKAAA